MSLLYRPRLGLRHFENLQFVTFDIGVDIFFVSVSCATEVTSISVYKPFRLPHSKVEMKTKIMTMGFRDSGRLFVRSMYAVDGRT